MSLFRDEAVENRIGSSDQFGTIGASVPFTWPLISLIIVFFLIFVSISLWFVRVPQKTIIRGALEYAEGVATIDARYTGAVLECNVDNDQIVSKGDVLVTIDVDDHVEGELSLSTAAIAASLEELHFLENRLEQIAEKHEIAREISLTELEEVSSSISDLKSKLILQQELLRFAEERERLSRVDLAEGLIGKQAVDANYQDVLRLKIAVNETEAQINKYQINDQTLRKTLKQTELSDTAERQGLIRDIAKANSSVAANTASGSYAMIAPMSGTVTNSRCQNGVTVLANEPIMMVTPTNDQLFGAANVPNDLINTIHEGDSVSLVYDALPKNEYGHQLAIVSEISRTTTTDAFSDSGAMVYYLEISIPSQSLGEGESAETLRSGMAFTAEYTVKSERLVKYIFG